MANMNIFKSVNELGKIKASTPCLFYQGDHILVLKYQEKFILPDHQQLHFVFNTHAVFFMTADNGKLLLVADMCEAKMPDGFSLENARDIYHHFNDDERAFIAKTFGYVHWHRNHRFCGRCAQETVLDNNECAMICPNCRYHYYPQVNPSMIVLVHRGDEILLARSPHFPPGMFSALAGYVSPGETVEQTVAREVLEEVNIVVKNIQYVTSQPWPFPNTLMLGFYAEYASGDLQIDKKEIEAAGWFTKDNLPPLPRHISIARHLIDQFLLKNN
jgi:NAD+ diphosphatase